VERSVDQKAAFAQQIPLRTSFGMTVLNDEFLLTTVIEHAKNTFKLKKILTRGEICCFIKHHPSKQKPH